ncbi:MAG: efflux RND transporter periplasmic adaptor subunit [Verrucomicrobiota bacterium JB022]|nr:efflux RND transporter periplasmic adaptor subunit [Verrucomicrobiota bacterium JB022]
MTTQSDTNLAGIIEAANPKRRSKARYFIIAAILIAGAVGWFIWSRQSQTQEPVNPYETQPLTTGTISLSVTATGNLEPTNEVTVGSELSGTVLEVYVDTNDQVTKGQPLAKLDTTVLDQTIRSSRATLRSSEARVNQAQATLKEAEAGLTRLEELRKLSDGRLPSTAEMDAAIARADRARADLLVAEAAVGEAEARVQINESDLSKAVLKSPIDGLVLTRAVEPGQTVAASFTAPELFVIAESLENMELLVTVAEADIGRLAKGQKATFTVDAWPGRTYEAEVILVAYGSTVTENVVTYETELSVSNPDLSLRPGMTATADIQVAAAENVFVVPNSALRFDPVAAAAAVAKKDDDGSLMQNLQPMGRRMWRRDGPGNSANGVVHGRGTVWVLRDGEPQAVQVRTGLTDGIQTEIISDELSEGSPIILRLL